MGRDGQQKTARRWIELWNRYSRGTALLSGALFLSGGLAYSELRKFRQRLKVLPDMFDMEKKLKQYIYISDLQDSFKASSHQPSQQNKLFPSRLPSLANRHPFVLLRLVYSENEHVHQLALKALVKYSHHWSDGDCLMVAQAIDLPTSVRLARTKDVDLRLFRQAPKIPPAEVAVESELQQLLGGLSMSDVGACTRHFTEAALQFRQHLTHSSHKPSDWNFDVGESSSYRNQSSMRRHTDHILMLLHALLQHCQVADHCEEVVKRGILYTLRRVYEQYGGISSVAIATARLVASLSISTAFHSDIFNAGWVRDLAKWQQSSNLALSLIAAKTLANMDVDTRRVRQAYLDGVFVYHPLFRGDGFPINADIVFFHGLLGTPFITWRQRDSTDIKEQNGNNDEVNEAHRTACWPKDWLSVDCPHARLLSIEYDTKLSHWALQCPYELERRTLEVRSQEIMRQLLAAGVGSRPIVWIGHSMGGLLIKQLLVSASEMDSAQNLVSNTRGVVFYSVPHDGSSLADYSLRPTAAYLLYPSVEVQELRQGSEKLKSLHNKFTALMQAQNVALTSFPEVESTNLPLRLRATIVPQKSSDPGFGELYVIPGLNHLNVCKPSSRTSELYRTTLQSICRSLPMSCDSSLSTAGS